MKSNIPFSFFLFTAIAAAQSYSISTVAGSSRLRDGSAATTAPLREPNGVAEDSAGNIYFADTTDNWIRRVDTKGIISTVAGTGVAGFSGDGGPATQAMLNSPYGIKLDVKAANLYIADYNNHRVRMVVLATGVISTVAGNGNVNWSGDTGIATQIPMDVYDIAVDSSENVYIADFLNSRIRKVSPAAGTVSTIAGIANPGDAGDGGPAAQAALDGPIGISIDAQNNIYFIDSYNNRVRKSVPAASSPTLPEPAPTAMANLVMTATADRQSRLSWPFLFRPRSSPMAMY